MSSGYKHLYSCITFLIFIFVINFYKNRIGVSRDREASFRAGTKLKRGGALNKPLPIDGIGDDFFLGFPSLDRDPFDDRRSETADGAWGWDRLKQYPGRCLDVEVFFLTAPPRITARTGVRIRAARFGGPDPEGLHYRTAAQEARRRDHSNQSDEPNSSIFMFLSVLVILVFAAVVDIAKHLTAVRAPRQPSQRRLSLQNYQALIREKQKQFRMMKQHYSQPSMSIQRSMDDPTYGQPFPTFPHGRAEEPPAGMQHQVKGLPAPLLRRQSVPTLMRSPSVHQATPGGISVGGRNGGSGPTPFIRRTSVDFWDTEHLAQGSVSSSPGNGSPPEARRRVRMLHRH